MIAGPVDVYVYDEAGTLVAGGINEKVVNDTLAVSVKCGEKVVDLPKDQEYRIAIKARTAGTVKYTVEEKSVTGSVNTVNAVEFEEITIKRGDVLEGSIGVDTAAQEYSLTKNGETVIYPTGDREEPPEGDDKNAMFNINVDPAENGSADLSTKAAAKGDTVYITPVPDDGYMLSSLRMSAGDGSKVEVSKKANGDYAFVMPGAEVTIRVTFRDAATGPVNPVGPTDPVDPVNPTDPIDPAPGNPFDDVKAGAYYYGAVLWAVENGITTGTSQTTFSPNIVCTRAQAVTFLWRAAGSPVVSGVQNPFADIDKSAYYYNAVLWGVKNGIVKGTGDATFGPDDICSRGQIVTLQWRANGGQQVPGTNPFADVAMDAYYGQAVLWAVKEGITNGTSLTTFSPENTCSRGEIVTFLYRDAQ
ncbi:MAG: S-layer homology domain-containing protein [Ruminiclostridium sp.]|nr:S-layer homology domain-containing protein [Ruminiclostridium sp.]